MTVQEARQDIISSTGKIYNENEAAIVADLLLENICGLSRTEQISKKNLLVTEEQQVRLADGMLRLLNHEPIQYIINEAWFYGLKFYVDKNVLIPRPETEELIECIISNLKFPIDTLKILDIGSGSGCIPIALKRKLRKAEVWSCDISKEALAVAKQNALALGADINFLQLNFLDEKETTNLPVFDIIVSNPPYVPERDKATMQPNVLHYEPHTALFVPDNDALIFYKTIAAFAKQHLNNNGSIFLEIHEEYGNAVKDLFLSEGFTSVEIKKDMQGKDRILKILT